jgi:hypothetical protein
MHASEHGNALAVVHLYKSVFIPLTAHHPHEVCLPRMPFGYGRFAMAFSVCGHDRKLKVPLKLGCWYGVKAEQTAQAVTGALFHHAAAQQCLLPAACYQWSRSAMPDVRI